MPTDNMRKRMVVEEVNQTSPEAPKVDVPPVEPVVETPPVSVQTDSSSGSSFQMPHPEEKPNVGDYSSSADVSESSNITWILIPGIMLLGALLGGIIFYQNRVSEVSQKADSTPVSTIPASSPSPTSTSEAKAVDLQKYSIVIQNGSGIAGEAGKVQTLLEKAGFKVASTANASTFDYTKTVIQAKSDMDQDFISKLTETLGETYSVDSKTATLSASNKNSVVVIVGSSKI